MSFQGSAEQGYLNLDAAQGTNRLHVHFPMNVLDHIIDHCRFGWRLQDLLIKLEMRNAFACFSFNGQSSSGSSACAGMWSQKKTRHCDIQKNRICVFISSQMETTNTIMIVATVLLVPFEFHSLVLSNRSSAVLVTNLVDSEERRKKQPCLVLDRLDPLVEKIKDCLLHSWKTCPCGTSVPSNSTVSCKENNMLC